MKSEITTTRQRRASGAMASSIAARSVVAAARELGSAVEFPADPQRVAASGAGRHDAYAAGVVEECADPVATPAEQPGQDEGEFGQHVLLPAARAADHHGRRSVEDQPGGQLAVLVELAHLRFVEPGSDVPVDVPGVVALDVRPQPGEVETATAARGAIRALDAPVEPPHDPPLQLDVAQQQAVGASPEIMAGAPHPVRARRAARG